MESSYLKGQKMSESEERSVHDYERLLMFPSEFWHNHSWLLLGCGVERAVSWAVIYSRPATVYSGMHREVCKFRASERENGSKQSEVAQAVSLEERGPLCDIAICPRV